MTHGHASQEAEHAAHAAHDPFDRRVALSMVVIAALLAMVKVLGHRAHNETLQYQIETGVAHTQESDQWNFFQAKKMREVIGELRASLLSPELGQSRSEQELLTRFQKDLDDTLLDLQGDPRSTNPGTTKVQAEKGLAVATQAREALRAKAGVPADRVEQFFQAKVQAQRYKAEAQLIANHAAIKHGEALIAHAKSVAAHHKADWFDLGELGVELALVLSSVAILSRRSGYWHAGILLCVLGLVAVAKGFLTH